MRVGFSVSEHRKNPHHAVAPAGVFRLVPECVLVEVSPNFGDVAWSKWRWDIEVPEGLVGLWFLRDGESSPFEEECNVGWWFHQHIPVRVSGLLGAFFRIREYFPVQGSPESLGAFESLGGFGYILGAIRRCASMVLDAADIDDWRVEEGLHPGTEPLLMDVGHVGENVEMRSAAFAALEYGQESKSLGLERGADLPAELAPCVHQLSRFEVWIVAFLEGNSYGQELIEGSAGNEVFEFSLEPRSALGARPTLAG